MKNWKLWVPLWKEGSACEHAHVGRENERQHTHAPAHAHRVEGGHAKIFCAVASPERERGDAPYRIRVRGPLICPVAV